MRLFILYMLTNIIHSAYFEFDGIPIDIEQFPFIVQIQKIDNRYYIPSCSGSIISHYLILTVAQCFVKNNVMEPLHMYLVYAGVSSEITEITQYSEIHVVHIHPKYEDTTKYNDISLVELANKLTYTSNVKPVVLAATNLFDGKQPDEFFDRGDCIVTKWGCSDQSSVTSTFLQSTYLSIFKKSECSKFLFIEDTQLCTNYLKITDKEFCMTDVGIPLICKEKQVGILSWTFGMDIWTRVDQYYDWIQEIIKTYNEDTILSPKNSVNLIPTTSNIYKKNGNQNSVDCIRNNISFFSYIVTIQKRNDDGDYSPSCTGSIISKYLILTSAQCFMNNEDNESLKTYLVYLGFSPQTTLASQLSEIDTLHLHPKYDEKTKYNDIALIKLKEELIFNENVNYVVLAQSNMFDGKDPSEYFENNECIVTKWSCTYKSYTAIYLECIIVPIITKLECLKHLYVDANQLCTDFQNIKEEQFCESDIGVPLICKGQQVGILSWTFGIDVWTRVDQYYEWILLINKTWNKASENEDETLKFHVNFNLIPDRINIHTNSETQNNYCNRTDESLYSHTVTLQKQNERGDYSFFCTGSIISNYLILTSAQCFSRYEDDESLRKYLVYVGLSHETALASQLSKIDSLHLHPKYEEITKYNDIALVKLKDELIFTENVRSVVLPRPDMFDEQEPAEYFQKKDCIVTKWNCPHDSNTEVFLKCNIIPLITNFECLENIFVQITQLCTNFRDINEEVFCESDVGDPLICKGYQIGILSWSFGMDIWTRVDQFYDWIQEIISMYDKTDENSITNVNPITTPSTTDNNIQNKFDCSFNKVNGFSHIATIQKKNEHGDYSLSCTGSIITNYLILTSAQCFAKIDKNESLEAYIVYAGLSYNTIQPLQSSKIDTLHLNPRYEKITNYNHIALLKLKKGLIFNEDVKPIVLAQPSLFDEEEPAEYFEKNDCIVTKSNCPDDPNSIIYLECIMLPIITKLNCIKYLYVVTTQLCTNFESIKDEKFCDSDVGDPLICNGYQIGILSWSSGMDIWTRVDQYYDWIQEIIKISNRDNNDYKTSNVNLFNTTNDSQNIFHCIPNNVNVFSHIATIQQQNEHGDYYLSCTGSIITNYLILTSAQCFTTYEGNEYLHTYVVHAGLSKTKQASQMSKIDKLHIHPKYERMINYKHIALIKLKEGLTFNENVKPIILAQPSLFGEIEPAEFYHKNDCIITKLDCSDNPNAILFPKCIILPIIPKVDCMKYMYVETTQLCTDSKSIKEGQFCESDVGNPLICDGQQIGILSLSFGVDIWTRVDQFYEWILEINKTLNNDSKYDNKTDMTTINVNPITTPNPIDINNDSQNKFDCISNNISIFTHIVTIQKRNEYGNYSHSCTGTIISPDLILTVAQCFVENKNNESLQMYKVHLPYNTKLGLLNIDALHINPKYEENTKLNDIALIKLKDKLIFNENVKPIILVQSNTFYSKEPAEYFDKDECIVNKWSCFYESKIFFKCITLPIITKLECAEFMYVESTQFCTQFESTTEEGFCENDIGDPLICNGKLIGIFSWSFGRDIWTRVDQFYDWIQENLRMYDKPGENYDKTSIINVNENKNISTTNVDSVTNTTPMHINNDTQTYVDCPLNTISLLPHMVTIQKRNKQEENSFTCTGSIISHNLVLTSAQCFDSNEYKQLLQTYMVYAGASYATTLVSQFSSIDTLHLHPKYEEHKKNNDIALVKLTKELIFNDVVKPVVLPQPNMFDEKELALYFEKKDCMVTKWSCPYESNSTIFLKCIILPIITTLECSNYVGIDITQFCTNFISIKGVEFCESDVGDPLICKGYQIGILSWSYGIDIWTRVDKYYEWIQDIKRLYTTNKTNAPMKFRNTDISKVFEGYQSDISDFPFMVTIQKMNGNEGYSVSCSGTIISNYLILTSAQCFVFNETLEPLHKYLVCAGISDATNLKHCQSSKIEQLHLHPEYKYKSKNHDISLVKLKTKLVYNRNVMPIDIIQSKMVNEKELTEYFKDKQCFITKWGNANELNNKSSKFLRIIYLPIIKQSECAKFSHVEATQICTYLKKINKIGFGVNDFGNPLICDGRQTGILSQIVNIDIWTRVDKYEDWIVKMNSTYMDKKNEIITSTTTPIEKFDIDENLKAFIFYYWIKEALTTTNESIKNNDASIQKTFDENKTSFIVIIEKKDIFEKYSPSCLGSIINHYLILTSAHCFVNYEKTPLNMFRVCADISHLTNLKYSQSSEISTLHLLPNYKYTSEINDICLAKLKNGLVYNKNVAPVILVQPDMFKEKELEEYFDGENCWVTRLDCSYTFGNTKGLKVTSLSIISKMECPGYVSETRTQFCTDIKRGNSERFCANDVGNPLICKGRQIGILSSSLVIDIWTKVDPYYYWIKDLNITNKVDTETHTEVLQNFNLGLIKNKFGIEPNKLEKINKHTSILFSTTTNPITTINDKIIKNFFHSIPINISDFPHVVSIQRKIFHKFYYHICSGSIISKYLVLTSAQCFIRDGKRKSLHKYMVYAGTSDAMKVDDIQSSKIHTVHIHPEYKSTHKNHDIGLVKLHKKLIFNEYVKPIVLAPTDMFNGQKPTEYLGENNCIAHKWDCIFQNKYNILLKTIHVSLLEKSICKQNFFIAHIIEDTQICTIIADSDKKDLCSTDIGTPLICKGYQVGMLSWSFFMDIWTRIDHYYHWIKKINKTYNAGKKYIGLTPKITPVTNKYKGELIFIHFNENNLSQLIKFYKPSLLSRNSINDNSQLNRAKQSFKMNFICILYVLLFLFINIFLTT